jgi:hypothetical protein
LLSDPEWSQSSDREIARRCVVDHRSVGRLRRQLLSGEIPQMRGLWGLSPDAGRRGMVAVSHPRCNKVRMLGGD